jgi:glutaredoxin-related protein
MVIGTIFTTHQTETMASSRRFFLSVALLIGSSVSFSPIYDTLRQAKVLDPRTGEPVAPISSSSLNDKKKALVVLLPQLGEFDSSEFCEHLVAVQDDLKNANIDLTVIGIGDANNCATSFSKFTGLSLEYLRVDPDATLHKELNLHAGPGWDVPDFVSDELLTFLLNTLPGGAPSDSSQLRPVGKAWLNYLAMCAGIGAPGTLREILRGYFGDAKAPERFADDDIVKAGFVTIGPGVGPVKLGPISYSQWWEDERGYQRPVELATVRLKNMVEVLTKWDTYVSNPITIDQRGATYLFSETGEMLYEYRHKGVLTYSETMPRPLTFLAPYIGEEKARNPLGLLDKGEESGPKHGRGILKPFGKGMQLLAPVFKLEAKLQADLLGAEENDYRAARDEIENAISSNNVVIYTYGLSPFSSEATALLRDVGCTDYKQIELGPEWFLLDAKNSAMRVELLAKTGQCSLPHIFIGGKHIGGLYTGTENGGPGLAALRETGELQLMLAKK